MRDRLQWSLGVGKLEESPVGMILTQGSSPKPHCLEMQPNLGQSKKEVQAAAIDQVVNFIKERFGKLIAHEPLEQCYKVPDRKLRPPAPAPLVLAVPPAFAVPVAQSLGLKVKFNGEIFPHPCLKLHDGIRARPPKE